MFLMIKKIFLKVKNNNQIIKKTFVQNIMFYNFIFMAIYRFMFYSAQHIL